MVKNAPQDVAKVEVKSPIAASARKSYLLSLVPQELLKRAQRDEERSAPEGIGVYRVTNPSCQIGNLALGGRPGFVECPPIKLRGARCGG